MNEPSSGFANETDWLQGLVGEQLILPSQFYERGAAKSPEWKLCMAILVDAVLCWQGAPLETIRPLVHLKTNPNSKIGKAVWAHVWVLTDDPDSVFSFDSICETLGLEPGIFRKRLLAWRASAAGARRIRRPGTVRNFPAKIVKLRERDRHGVHQRADRADIQRASKRREVRPVSADNDLDAAFGSVPAVLREVRPAQQP